jgi:hypothetical protein
MNMFRVVRVNLTKPLGISQVSEAWVVERMGIDEIPVVMTGPYSNRVDAQKEADKLFAQEAAHHA